MYWQRELLRDTVSMTFNQTFELDLPKTGLLGSLALYVTSTQNGGPFLTVPKWRLIDYLSKIELIGDGAEVIKSFDGRQALACAFYDNGVVPDSMWRHYSNTPHRQVIPINFGRRLFDSLHALDLSRFDQVKLKVTNNATSTQFTTDIKISVLAYWLREQTAPTVGYYREEEYKTWAPVAAAVEYTDLPTLLKIRRILLRARPAVDTADAQNNSSMGNLMNAIDFTIRTGQTRVYHNSLDLLARLTADESGKRAETAGVIDRTADYGFEVGIGYVEQFVSAPATKNESLTVYPLTVADHDNQDSSQLMRYRAADSPLSWWARGYGYMHNVPLFASLYDDDSDLLDSEADKTVKVDITCKSGTTVTGTSANAENAIVLSRLVP